MFYINVIFIIIIFPHSLSLDRGIFDSIEDRVLRLSTAAITSCLVVPLKAKGQIELTSIILIK